MRLFLYMVSAMLLLAITQMPYGFYQLLRLVTVVAFFTIAFREFQRIGWNIWVTIAIIGALAINPIMPIRLSKGLWQIINLLMAMAVGLYTYRFPNR